MSASISRSFLTLAVALLSTAAPLVSQEAKKPNQKPERFEKEIQAFEAADQKNPPPKGAILFTGASSIRRWTTLAQEFPGLTVINRGFGGSTIPDSVHFADRIVIPYAPKTIVLQAGGNDIHAGGKAEQVLSDFKAYVEKVRAKLPDVRIIYLGINPTPARWTERDEQKKANQLIRDYIASATNMDFIDLWDSVLGPNGEPREDLFVADKQHPNAECYQARAKIIRPHLE